MYAQYIKQIHLTLPRRMKFERNEGGRAFHTHTSPSHFPKGFSYTQRTQRRGEEGNSLTCKIATSTRKEIERSRIGETYQILVPMIEEEERKRRGRR